MFDILDLIHDATKEANSFENHPAKALPLEERLSYLNGLALVMNADAEISEDEKEYLRILIKSFDLDESCLNDFVTFAQAPDKDTIQAFFRTFRRKPVAQLFLFDAYMMGLRDGQLQDKERAVIDKMAEQLEVLKGTRRDIFDLFCHIKNKDWEESSLYFSSHLLNPEHFKHLLEYYEVDFNEDITSLVDARKYERLMENSWSVIFRDLTWGTLTNHSGSHTEVTTSKFFLESIVSYGMLLPWIQHKIDTNEIRISGGNVYRKDDELIMSMTDSGFVYDSLGRYITITSEISEDDLAEDSPIVNMYLEDHDDLPFMISDRIFSECGIALANGPNLPLCDGKQISAITTGHYIGNDGHPNAISEISETEIEVRYCSHCKGGHGSKSKICNDGDRRFKTFSRYDFIIDHGVYLTK